MNYTSRPLPESVQEIANVIGREAALTLVKSLPRRYPTKCHPSGRVIVSVPARMPVDHMLVTILGFELAERLARYFGGTILSPACLTMDRHERDAAILAMRADGYSAHEIAEHHGITDRHVRNILAKAESAEVVANDNSVNIAAA